MALVRRARREDSKGIHEAHMRSILEICSKHHTKEEVAAWGGRPYREDQRHHAINNHLVWVAEQDEDIKGFGHFIIKEKDDQIHGHVLGLYLTPEVTGQGIGKKIFQLMLREAKCANVKSISLESTLTAHEFYKKLGFNDRGEEIKVEIGGVGIRCFPMDMLI
jgi:GNAT superfamily N-acetyltransferase